MKRISPFKLQTPEHRLMGLVIFAALCVALFIYPHPQSSAIGGDPQQRRRTRPAQRRGARPPARRTAPARNRSKFNHSTKGHAAYTRDREGRVTGANCTTCHKIASPSKVDLNIENAPGRKQPFFDVLSYPDHESCVGCHRMDFFRGARPQICTICHVNVSPRDGRQFGFPKRTADDTSDFPGTFPHAKHQDILALIDRPRPEEERRGWQLLRASFHPPAAAAAADVNQPSESCAFCHKSYAEVFGKEIEKQLFQKTTWPQGTELDEKTKWPVGIFESTATINGKENTPTGLPVGTFKVIPKGGLGHRTCFVCHASREQPWQSPEPVATNCVGCHNVASRSRPTLGATATAGGPRFAPGRESFPANARLPLRRIFVFQHDTGGHQIECTTCHVNIAQATTLSIPRPDVPITSCVICHLSTRLRLQKDGKDLLIQTEVELKDKDSKYNCSGCHTAEVGSRLPKCSHYDALGKTPGPGKCIP